MALNALLHSYLPDQIPYDTLRPENCVDNFQLAFQVAEAASIPHSLVTIYVYVCINRFTYTVIY